MTAATENAAGARRSELAAEGSGLVITRLVGGLGNQLFQYAAGRRIALVNGFRLKLDTSDLGRKLSMNTRREYRLRQFRIVAEFASPEELARLRGSRVALFLNQFVKCTPRALVKERHVHFDPRILEIRTETYLFGYWQSEKYFADVADVIRGEVSVKTPPTNENRRSLDRIEGTESVSVHVRRGDYVTNPKARRLHGNCCPLEYYRAGIAEIIRRTPNPHFFVFSDDIGWARENLSFDAPASFVDQNGPGQDFEDLRLMSKCRHHIIANSSFSWWGAWLAAHGNQIVVAPKNWLATGNHQTQDICPPHWIRM